MRIKELRKEKGITQNKFATELGISKCTISLYESGKREPDIATLLRIANYFDVSVDYLLGVVNVKKPNNGALSESEIMLLDLLNMLDLSNKRLLLKTLAAFNKLPTDKQDMALAMIRAALETQNK